VTTIAVTGPTGTFGFGLIPPLQADDRVERIVGIARRPFDPLEHGWAKLAYRQGDVRDRAALTEAFAGADAVAHLAFAIYGTAPRETLRQVNVDGTLNAFHAAVDAGARRFVHASSVAAYGFRADNPEVMDETWPARGSELFYAREKADLEQRLLQAAAARPEIELTLLRPTVVVGPHAAGAGAELVPGPLRPLARGLVGLLGAPPLPLPAVPPPVPLQLVHEDDVGQAFALALLGDGPAGTYNLAGDGVLSGEELVRELGLVPLPVPPDLTRAAVGALLRLPVRPPALEWAEAALHPLVVDASLAKRRLGWRPAYTTRTALRDTLRRLGPR